MPYKLSKRGSKFCVVSKTTGENKGCSDSRAEAIGHMRAMYAAEGKKKKEIDSLVAKSIIEMEEIPEAEIAEDKSLHEIDNIGVAPLYYGIPTSYAELEKIEEAQEVEMEVNELVGNFPMLVRNIMDSPDITDKSTAVNALANELATKINEYSQPSMEEDKEVEDPHESIFTRVMHSVKELFGFVKKEEDESNMMIWKESDGWKWLARYSNTFRDRDNPPEIIASKSHRRFVELVDKGLAPLPELQIWHDKNLKVGQALWVAYDEVDDNSGFALASGYFLPGTEQVAEWLSNRKDIGVSHGMPVSTIKRDESDPTIIIEHETREISALPAWVAANDITGFVAFKEADMAIPTEKRKKLVDQWGMTEEMLDLIEGVNKTDAGKAIEVGIESKELEQQPEEVAKEEQVVETEVVKEEVQEVSQDYPTRDEIAEALRAVMDSVTVLGERITAISKDVSELKEKQIKQETETLKNTPNASLLSMLTGRAVGNKEAEVDADSDLAKSKPKETKDTGRIGIPFLDEMLSKN